MCSEQGRENVALSVGIKWFYSEYIQVCVLGLRGGPVHAVVSESEGDEAPSTEFRSMWPEAAQAPLWGDTGKIQLDTLAPPSQLPLH